MNDLIKLTNPEFDLEFDGKTYRVRKANLDKAVQYQQKIKEFSEKKESSNDLKLVAFAIFLVLREYIPNITEDQVLDKTPADIDVIEVLTNLGFINPKMTERARRLQEAVEAKLTTAVSSPTSPNAPAGHQ